MLKKLLCLVALVVGMSDIQSVHAAIVLSDSFETNGALVGQSPQIGGAWAGISGVGTNPINVVNGRVVLNASGEDIASALSSPVTPVNGASIFTSQIVNITAASATGDYFSHLGVTATALFNRLHARSSVGGFQLGIVSTSGGAVVSYGTTDLSFGTDYQVVTAWDFTTGALNDTFSVFVNPIDPIRGNNTPYLNNIAWGSTTAEPTTIGFGNLRQGGNFPTLTLDNFVVATAFSDVVTAVPEPTSIALVGIVGTAGLAVRYRRKNASQSVAV